MNEWNVASSNNGISSKKRAYVGNLKHTNDIEFKLQKLFQQSAISINREGIEIVKLGNLPKGSDAKCIALVQCDIESAIKCLDGVQFEGRVINVQREKKRKNNKDGMAKFGGGWSKPPSSRTPIRQEKQSVKRNPGIEMGSVQTSRTEYIDSSLSKSLNSLHVNNNERPSHDVDNVMDRLSKEVVDNISNFHARCNSSLDNLMEEYGQHDPNFEQMVVKEDSTDDRPGKSNENVGMLAPNGKAPIHIEIISFGFKYSVPARAREGWSHANPLAPIDCRSLPRCPHHVAKLSGLSFKVKRTLLSNIISSKSEESDDIKGGTEVVNPIVAKSDEISCTVLKGTLNAINEGGHGYAFPLGTSIYLGSEYGRHRSVVLAEKVAQDIRKLLRENDQGAFTQPISVSTRHRDIDQNHTDEEAFGFDLRRQHQAEMKRKKKQERLEEQVKFTSW